MTGLISKISEICSSWRLAIKELLKKHTQLPWLMLVDPDDSSYRRFYSLSTGKVLKIDLSPFISPPQTTRYFSSRGWLISLTKNITKSVDVAMYFNITVFNPFSNNSMTIETPLFDLLSDQEVTEWEDVLLLSFFEKIVVSTSPNNGKDGEDFVVAITFGDRRKVAYWRLGHGDTWVVPSLGLNYLLQDLCFFRGELYATQYDGIDCRVIAFGDLKDHKNSRQPRVVAHLGSVPANMKGDFDNYYLVESKYDQADTSSLLVIYRFVAIEYLEKPEEVKYNTSSFNVFKLNVDNGNVENVMSLGNQAIFVGFNSTFSVNVDEDRGCKADSIYYTDHSYELYFSKNQGGGSDMGIYSLPHGNTLPLYEGPSRFSLMNPPTWIEFCNA